MIYYILLAVSIMLTVCKSSVYNAYAKKAKLSLLSTFGFYAISYGVAALIGLLGLFFGEITVSLPTVLCALAYAAVVSSLQTISVSAMKLGAMSLTSIFVMYGMIIPSFAGPLFWGESFGVLQGGGIGMMLVSLRLLKEKSSDKGGALSKKG